MLCLIPQLFLPVYPHANVGSPAPPAAALPTLVLQSPPCCESSPPRLPISTPPTSLDECFFSNSLVVKLPYSSIFCQFWLFFVFKFVVVFLLVVQGGQVFLSILPSWPEVYLFVFRGDGKGREGGRERSISVWLPLTCPLLRTWPATQACGLTGYQTSTLWFVGPCSVH